MCHSLSLLDGKETGHDNPECGERAEEINLDIYLLK
jgi:hypothetical protein